MQWVRPYGRLLFVLTALVGVGAIAQVVTSTSPPVFRTGSTTQTFSTLDDAEAAMRADSAYFGAAGQLEHFQTMQIRPDTLRLQYALRERTAVTFYGAMYFADIGPYGQGKGSCTVLPPDPKYATANWCGSEPALIAAVEQKLRTVWPDCTLTGTSVTHDYARPQLEPTFSPITHGDVRYQDAKQFTTTATCTSGAATRSHDWNISKKTTLHCSTGFQPIGMPVNEATLEQDNVCRPRNDDVAWIEAPIQQCGSCAGSRNPIYPATGEKQRHEDDFTFAGRTFTRHYRSLRQFRNNRNFAVGWNHTWSDRIISTATSSAPYAHIDESGNYESYTLLAGSQYRGENSVGRMLERINADGISFRLRMPDGEVRDFDLEGLLIAIRNPNAPLNDLTLVYVNKVLSTVTDAQGRMLRFESSGNLLRRIVLPDGTAIAYSYDGDRNLTGVTYPGNVVRQYHYNESGLAGAANQRHHLTGITAEDGRRYAAFSYDARGRVASSRVLGSPNELTTISYPTEDSATMNTAEGGTRAYAIESGTYRRILATQEGSATEQRTYDAQGRLQSRTDKRSIRTE